MEILNIALVNCENQFYCLSVPTRWHLSFSPPLVASLIPISTSSFIVFYGYGVYTGYPISFNCIFLSWHFYLRSSLKHNTYNTHTHTKLLRIKGYYQKMKTQAIEWKKLFANQTSDKGPVPECTGFVYSEWEQLVIAIGSFCGWREGWTRSLGLTDANYYTQNEWITFYL